MRLGGNATVPSTSITKNSDTSYTYYDAGNSMHFNFSSDTEGTITLSGDGGSQTFNVTKK